MTPETIAGTTDTTVNETTTTGISGATTEIVDTTTADAMRTDTTTMTAVVEDLDCRMTQDDSTILATTVVGTTMGVKELGMVIAIVAGTMDEAPPGVNEVIATGQITTRSLEGMIDIMMSEIDPLPEIEIQNIAMPVREDNRLRMV